MNRFLREAEDMKDEIISARRTIHENAEVGFELTKTVSFVIERLRSYGYEPVEKGGGVVCTCGKKGRVIMLRADMDALPQREESGLEFACRSGRACHSCGHDCHTAMLLGAAKILKKHENELEGTVKFVFQPGEETLRGSRRMIEAGVLEDPKVDVGMGLHMNFGNVGPDEPDVGTLLYTNCMASADEFMITVKGRTAHGGTPENGISALSVGAAIVGSVQQFMTLEIPCDDPAVLSFGTFSSGTAANIIPDEAKLTGSIRTFSRENRKRMKERLVELCEKTASCWNAECSVEFTNEVGPNINSVELTEEMLEYCGDVVDRIVRLAPVKGSEDFANYGEYIPTFFANIGGGGPKHGYLYSMHDPRARLDEDALPYGTAVFVNCAVNWLKNHRD